jgi:AraC-like DNA-binding protein
MNSKKLAKGFKMIYGDTIFRYLRKLCLQRASLLLLDTDKFISEIAYDMGYSNPSNFCYAFKKEYGMTPLQYRVSSLLKKSQIIRPFII